MIRGPSMNRMLLHTGRVPGEEPLPYVRTGRQTVIAGIVMACHAGLIIVPMIFLAISEMIKPPVYVMRLPTVDSVPNENPDMSPHPSPLNRKSKGTPDKGKPLSKIPKIPDLVRPIDPPKPKPQPQPKPKPQPKPVEKPPEPVKKVVKKKPDPVKPKTVAESKKTVPVQQPKPAPQKKLLDASDIKISTRRVKNPNQNPSPQPAQPGRTAADNARNARMIDLARQLRSMTGIPGGTGTPGGGGGPKGIVSKEVNDYYYKVEAYLKRRWEQPAVYGDSRPKVIILFRVAADGRIISAVIQERSGNAAMDTSVERMLKSLQTLPAPPQAMSFTVTMEIDR